MSKQKQPRRLADADVGMFGAESSPSRSAPIALVVSSALCGQAASLQAHADVATPTPVDRAERANKWVVLALSGTATFMTTLDASIVNIGLPSIARAFGVPLSGNIEWVLIGYLVVIAAVLLTFGRLADMLGRKPLFLAGLAVFTIGSALCGAAPSLGTLIAARCFQGLGAAAILCVNVAMITRSFPAAERGRALGLNMILLALGVSMGPTIGGILTQALSWRWIFYVNLPIGALALLAASCLLTERYHLERQRFDLPGAALLATGAGRADPRSLLRAGMGLELAAVPRLDGDCGRRPGRCGVCGAAGARPHSGSGAAQQAGLRVRERQLHDLHAGPFRGELSPAVLPRGVAWVGHAPVGAVAHAAPTDAGDGGTR